MRRDQLAVQCYTIREQCRDAGSFAESMQKVKAIGFSAVQISGVGPIPEAEIARICAGEGLAICATHESGATICNSPQRVIDRLGALGTRYTAYPYPHVPLDTATQVHELAAQLDRAGAALHAAGQVLTYHNHAVEFRRFGARTALDILYAETKPAHLQGEIDTYWVQTGGGDPVRWIEHLCGRLPLLHLKDYAIGADGAPAQMAEIGNGNLDWARIIPAAERAGCVWFIVEQDVCPGDPFASLRQSWDFLQAFVTKLSSPDLRYQKDDDVPHRIR
jgi:sugar phosphate isomerase/epimerase